MKNKKLLIAVVVAAFAVGIIILPRIGGHKKGVIGKPAVAAKEKAKAKTGDKEKAQAPAKKTFSKGKGGLTVKVLGSGQKALNLRVKAFRVVDNDTSVFSSSLTSNRMGELNPGNYDIEIETLPAVITKGVKVVKGEETVKDAGILTGAINIKALTAKKKPAAFSAQMTDSNTGYSVATTAVNRPIEIISGAYDIRLETTPPYFMKEVKVESGKETAIDLGCISGILFVAAADSAGKDMRYPVRIRQAGKAEIVSSTATNRAVEVLEGSYDIEILLPSPQARKDVKVKAGEDVRVEIEAPAPAVPAAAVAAVPAPKTVKK